MRGNDTFCPLFGLQGRTGRILLSHSQRFILSGGLDKDKRSPFVYPGQMHVAFAIICQASRLCHGSWHKLYIGKEDEIWIGCEYWQCSKWFLSWWLQTWSYSPAVIDQKYSELFTLMIKAWNCARLQPTLRLTFLDMESSQIQHWTRVLRMP